MHGRLTAGRGCLVAWPLLTLVALLDGGCASSHDRRACDPEAGASTCRADEACRATYEGETICMRTCANQLGVCPTGEACLHRLPGPPFVCWVGGPTARGGACDSTTECALGLRCGRDGVCEEACDAGHRSCSSPGLSCAWGTCVVPVPPGAPCTDLYDCSPPALRCDVTTLFTCQAECRDGTCGDGRSCATDADCWTPPGEPMDTCTRDSAGSVGCRDGDVCAMTTIGVRRCIASGCRPDGSGVGCALTACLPDPEDAETYVCWQGGTVAYGDPCSTSYECRSGTACGSDGVCRYDCTAEGAPCAVGSAHPGVCRNFVCMPEST